MTAFTLFTNLFKIFANQALKQIVSIMIKLRSTTQGLIQGVETQARLSSDHMMDIARSRYSGHRPIRPSTVHTISNL